MCFEDNYMMRMLSGLSEMVEIKQLEPDINAKCWININYHFTLHQDIPPVELSCQASCDFPLSSYYLVSPAFVCGPPKSL